MESRCIVGGNKKVIIELLWLIIEQTTNKPTSWRILFFLLTLELLNWWTLKDYTMSWEQVSFHGSAQVPNGRDNQNRTITNLNFECWSYKKTETKMEITEWMRMQGSMQDQLRMVRTPESDQKSWFLSMYSGWSIIFGCLFWIPEIQSTRLGQVVQNRFQKMNMKK
jgi:hypothetical protein